MKGGAGRSGTGREKAFFLNELLRIAFMCKTNNTANANKCRNVETDFPEEERHGREGGHSTDLNPANAQKEIDVCTNPPPKKTRIKKEDVTL